MSAAHGRVDVVRQELRGKIRKLEGLARSRRSYAKRKESFTFLLAFAVYCKAGGDERILKTFFDLKVHKAASVTYMEWKAALEDKYVDADPEVIADIIDGAGPNGTGAVNRRAAKWLREYNLYTWVSNQNEVQGIAPSYKTLFRKRAALEQREIPSAPVAEYVSMRRKGTRWKKRFRRSWGLETGSFQAQEVLTEAVTRKKAVACWKWFHYCRQEAATYEAPLVLNLDETSLPFHMEPRRGIRLKKARASERAGSPARNTSKKQRRKAMTHVAIVCNDTSLQPNLPQVLLVAEKICSNESATNIRPTLPSNLHLWRRKSRWVNTPAFLEIIEVLANVLDKHAPGRPRILLMDALKIHCCTEVLTAARARRIRVVILAACCTHLLQPLDTHVFAKYKQRLRSLQQECRMEGPNEDLSDSCVVGCVMKAVREIFQGHIWARAFHENGFGDRDFHPRDRLLRKLGLTEKPPLLSELPSYEEFIHIFPARFHIDFLALAGPLPRERRHGEREEQEEPGAPGRPPPEVAAADAAREAETPRLRLYRKTSVTE